MEMLILGLKFYQQTGKQPRREDLRGQRRAYWQKTHGLTLPSERAVRRVFGKFSNYLDALGLKRNIRKDIEAVEEAAMKHVMEVYPDAALVRSEQSVYDLELGDKRIEVKGTQLTIRNDSGQIHWSWRLHKRKVSDLVDLVVLVGLDKYLEPVIRLEFERSSLRLLDGLDTLTVYNNVLSGGHSKYKPYIVWMSSNRLPDHVIAREARLRHAD